MTDWGFTLNNVTASWSENGDNNILTGINFKFKIRDAKTTALPLMGPSGQGKSTLLYLLAALKLPNAGTVKWRFPDDSKTYELSRLKSENIYTKGIAQLRREEIVQLRRDRFGFALQDSTLSLHLTIRENIAYPLALQGKKWNDALDMAEEGFEKVLLDESEQKKQRLLASFPPQLSGGERQRAALAQAIIHNPCVLFADEPTGQLDLATRKQVMCVLKQWLEQGQGKRCLIWVTHHHIDDLKMMKVNEFLFVENQNCVLQNRAWLENWINT